jgi:mannose-1-phosphate guanylyltransferase
MNHTHESQLWGIVLAAGEGTRVRSFLSQLCGGPGIKQFSAVLGRRSMLEQTLARVERLIPRERILIVVSPKHHAEVKAQLAQWPADNIIYQPINRETAPGILLPFAHVSSRDPEATVAVFPSDHFILDEARFMAVVANAAIEVQRFPRELVLLGVQPDRLEHGYGWIDPGKVEEGRQSQAVLGFYEKPGSMYAQELMARDALWNTLVFVTQTSTLWQMIRHSAPDLCRTFNMIRLVLNSTHAQVFTQHAYETMRTLNFSTGVCEPLTSRLRVLPVPNVVGWSDWGSAERILQTLQRVGKLDECLARLEGRPVDAETRELIGRFSTLAPYDRMIAVGPEKSRGVGASRLGLSAYALKK